MHTTLKLATLNGTMRADAETLANHLTLLVTEKCLGHFLIGAMLLILCTRPMVDLAFGKSIGWLYMR